MENEMETGDLKGRSRDPSIQIILTVGFKVHKYYLHLAIWIPRESVEAHHRLIGRRT